MESQPNVWKNISEIVSKKDRESSCIQHHHRESEREIVHSAAEVHYKGEFSIVQIQGPSPSMDGMYPIQDGEETCPKGDPTVEGYIHGECQEDREDIQGGCEDQPRRLCRGDGKFCFLDL